MKNSFGQNVCVTIFGESHGKEIGAVVDGFAPGIELDYDYISNKLALRRPFGDISTARREKDELRIVSGAYNNRTTGTPLCVVIKNEDINSDDYIKHSGIARPGHSDYSQYVKSGGHADLNGGGHSSGRLTAPIVAVGAIALKALENKGIYIGTRIKKCAGISDETDNLSVKDFKKIENEPFAVVSEDAKCRMIEGIKAAAKEKDSVGGVVETYVFGLPAGVGEPWFDSLESSISKAVFGIPAVKGISFGDGFLLADMKGSQANDAFAVQDGNIITKTNHNGGINGGISNGMPIVFSTVIKPTPSIAICQETVNFISGQNTTAEIAGRHDPSIVHRARVVIDSVTALVLCDLLAAKYGTDWLAK